MASYVNIGQEEPARSNEIQINIQHLSSQWTGTWQLAQLDTLYNIYPPDINVNSYNIKNIIFLIGGVEFFPTLSNLINFNWTN